MNEKIEDRNDELHRLKKKVTITVVTLSHTREKEQFVSKQNKVQEEKRDELYVELTKLKSKLSDLKKKREEKWKIN